MHARGVRLPMTYLPEGIRESENPRTEPPLRIAPPYRRIA